MGRLRSSYILKYTIWILILKEFILILKYLILLMCWHLGGSSIWLRTRSDSADWVETISKLILIFRLHFLLIWWRIIDRLSIKSACNICCWRCPNCLKSLIWIDIFHFLRVSLLYRWCLSIVRLNRDKVIFLYLYRCVYSTVWLIIILLLNYQILVILSFYSRHANIIRLVQ